MKGPMSRKGDCRDNAVTETLFGSMRVERLLGMRFATRRQANDEAMD
jgi:putative transposase